MSNLPTALRPQEHQHHTYYCRYMDPKGALNLKGKNEHEFYTESYADWVDFLKRTPPGNIIAPDVPPAPVPPAAPGVSAPPPANLVEGQPGAGRSNDGKTKI